MDRYYVFEAFGYAIFVHKIKKSDPRGVMHSHPWSWISLIFGSYCDKRLGGTETVRNFFNFCRSGVHHQVTLLDDKPVWTILIHGKRRCEWSVIDSVTGRLLEVEPWRGVENLDRTEYA